MKIKVLLVSGLLVTMFACKKDDDSSSTTTTTKTCMLNSRVEKDDKGGHKENEKMEYDANNKMVKITSYAADGTTIQETAEITYNSSGKESLITVKDKDGKATGEKVEYTYGPDGPTIIKNTEMDNSVLKTTTHTFTYTNGKLSAMVNDGNEGVNTKNIVWTNGNMTSLTLVIGSVDLPVKVQFDDKTNAYSYYPNDGDNAILKLNKNNMKYVIADASISIPNFLTINKGDTLINSTLTYSGDNVATIVNNKSVFQSEASTETFSITCK